MKTAAHTWLDLRVPYDDVARQDSLGLVEHAATALQEQAVSTAQPVMIFDIGAGTGNSAQWFKQHLEPRLPGRELQWVLVDTDRVALETAAGRVPEAHSVVAPITELPKIVDELLGKTPEPGQLLITGSAVLDVLTQSDLEAITETVVRHAGLGLVLLSINGDWQITPADPDDIIISQAFAAHQQRGDKLGAAGPTALLTAAHRAGITVTSGNSPWKLCAARDQEFLERFLAERIEAVVEQQPQLRNVAADWLNRRRTQLAGDLTVEVDHVDVYLDGRRR